VAVSIPSRKARNTLSEIGDGAGDFSDGPAQAVDRGHHDDVAVAGVVEHGGETRAG
jgi:hypothetical protein